jgi:hypothetical protein
LAPNAGDIVIRRETGNPREHYSIREHPGVAQVSYASLETALAVAKGFAQKTRTQVWFEQDGQLTLAESGTAASMA